MASDRDNWPKPQRCFTCEAHGQLVATESYSQSITGVRNHLYVCLACLHGSWYRYLPNDTAHFVLVDQTTARSALVRKALIGLGWTPPRGKSRPEWTPPT